METLWVDFNNMSDYGVVRLNCSGTISEIAKKKIELKDGLKLIVWTEDQDDDGNPDNLEVEAEVKYHEVEHVWVAKFDEDKWRHQSGKK